jgi:hypothetical protein
MQSSRDFVKYLEANVFMVEGSGAKDSIAINLYFSMAEFGSRLAGFWVNHKPFLMLSLVLVAGSIMVVM